MISVMTFALTTLGGEAAEAAPPVSSPRAGVPELGDVQWLRDYAQARALARQTGKPILVMFTEVPGCSTVNGFANEVLKHPVIVDAAKLVVPVAIYNNVSGADRQVLERWREPAWNNPMLRFIDADERELSSRMEWSEGVAGLARHLAESLEKTKQPVPQWLSLTAAQPKEKLTFAMHCFWEGEAELGAVEGVTSTRAGFEAGAEVVEVSVSSKQAADAVKQKAQQLGYRAMPGDGFRFSESDDKFRLKRSPYKDVKLAPAQQSKLNAAVGNGTQVDGLLSPSQSSRRQP